LSNAQLIPQEPDEVALASEGNDLVLEARAITVVSDADERTAADFLQSITASEKKVVSFFADMKKKAYDSWKTITAKESSELVPRSEAKRIVAGKLSAYRTEKERAAAEERREREAAARKIEEEHRLAEAQAAQDAGDIQAAEEIIAMPVQSAPIVVPIYKPSAVTYREVAQYEVTSIVELARHIAVHPEDANLLMPNPVAIRQLVTMRKTACRIPGIRVWMAKKAASGRI
jgi:hypothetical protein